VLLAGILIPAAKVSVAKTVSEIGETMLKLIEE